MPHSLPNRPILPIVLALLAAPLLAGLVVTAAHADPATARTSAKSEQPNSTRDAFARLNPQTGGPSNGGTVNARTKFTLDLLVNAGSNSDVTAAQNYLTFDNTVLQVIPASAQCGSSAPVSTTVSPDTTTFEATLQNEVCNGPNPCTFRGLSVSGGSIAYASGALQNCPNGCGGEFRVASITFCAANGGNATIRWQFAPPAPVTRDTEIINITSELVHDPARYISYIVHVTGPTATPGPPTATVAPTEVVPTTGPTGTPPPPGQRGTPCPMNFSDVPPANPYYEQVNFLFCRGVISGFPDRTFKPYDTTKRAQLAKMIVNAFGFPVNTQGGPHFTDVARDNEFYGVIETAYNRGIVTGFGNGLFKPWDPVKRGQIAKMVVLAAGWPTTTEGGPHFPDVPAGSLYYAFVETARSRSVIGGFEDGTFRVDENAKRGQLCKMLTNALSR